MSADLKIPIACLTFVLATSTRSMCQPDADLLRMTAQDFETRVVQESDQKSALKLCSGASARLKAIRPTSEKSILRCVEVYANLEETSARRGPAEARFANTLKFIDSLSSSISDEPLLRAKLVRRKGALFLQTGDGKTAAKELTESIGIVESIRPRTEEVDHQRAAGLVLLGRSLLLIGQVTEADKSFLKVLSYPWYTMVNNPAEMQEMRDLYVQAGFGLIEARRHNLLALKAISFVPATMRELGPALEKVIQEASR